MPISYSLLFMSNVFMKTFNMVTTLKLGYNEHSVIANEYFGPKSPFST